MKSRIMKQFFSPDEQKEEMSLQITSMADIFTIILIFLLKSFATGLATLTPPQGMVLPSVSTPTQSQMKEAMKVEILPNVILIDAKPVMTARNFQIDTDQQLSFQHDDPDSQAAQATAVSPKIVEFLVQERAKVPAHHSNTQLTLLAHEEAPYSIVRTVINSAASAGYADLQLVVLGAD